MPRQFLLLLLVLAHLSAGATTMCWLSTEQYLEQSALIAVLRIGEIHDVSTPEGISVESASATVEKVIYYQFAAEDNLPETIAIFQVTPNRKEMFIVGETRLSSGRFLAVLKANGMNKFIPYDRFSLQLMKEGEKLHWPGETAPMTDELTLEQIIERIEKARRSGKEKMPLPK